jgi:hypothetical protein
VAGSDIFVSWQQTGHKDGSPGSLRFYSDSGLASMTLTLEKRDGLYYAPTDVYTMDNNPIRPITPRVRRVVKPAPPSLRRPHQTYVPVTKSNQTESELWMLRLGSPGEDQLDMLPGNATGIPSVFEYHPFRFLDFKEQARVRKQAAQRSAERTSEAKKRYYMDFGFMRSSRSDYSRPNKRYDRVISSWDGYSSYLLIVDEASRFIWVFLTKSKDPPIDIIDKFLQKFGHADGGSIRTDQGGELAGSSALLDMVLRQHSYVFEPTGADSPSQNGQAEIYNDKLAVRTRTLLYGAGLPAKFWSSALLHAVYLHNRLVHSATKHTPFESFFGTKPDLASLKVFGSRVCVKRTGHRRSKLDRHDFTGIFIGYTATDNNITYIDLDSGLVKTSHHAQFDEAWYLQDSRPPAPQLLYDLGLEADDDAPHDNIPDTAQYPPLVSKDTHTTSWKVPSRCRHLHLPLRCTTVPNPITARAARVSSTTPALCCRASTVASAIAAEYHIGLEAMDMIYMSPDPYHDSFDELLDLRRCDLDRHPTAGLSLIEQNGRIILAKIQPGTPAAKIPRWRTRIRGAWLIKIGSHIIHSLADARTAFSTLHASGLTHVSLLFAHPEIRPDISRRGLPIVSSPPPFTQQVHDQLNNRWEFSTVLEHLRRHPSYQIVDNGGVLNTVTRVMKLTRGKLLKQPDWDEWRASEYLQLDQYDAQGMFGNPVEVDSDAAVFRTVWTYAIKALDGRYKARCTCDGSPRSGQARILDETYANCVDQTGARIFYSVAAAENLLILGADVSNAFAEAPPPKQGFYIIPDKAFLDWWINHKKRSPIPHGFVIPILSAMQGHPESPRLWEKHADAILREIGLKPTHHEPCLYTGNIHGNRVIFLRQVDDFAIATSDSKTADILLDMLDERLTIPIKRQGYLDMFNGINITQTRDYIKISCKSFIDKCCEKHLATWMSSYLIASARPTPLPCDPSWFKKFNAAIGNPDPKKQNDLAKAMNLSYRSGVGELIWAMTTCRPDLAFASVKLSQSNGCPHEHHYHGLRHALKYMYTTRDDGIYFWRTQPRMDLKEGPLPVVHSNKSDLLLDSRPDHDATTLHVYVDSDWATCVKTRRSFGGVCMRLAGGTIAYKTKFQPTVAGSSTEAEFMAAYDAGKMILFVRSILWDLGIPQEAATLLYEDNDACTAMANAQKPTPRTRHIDIKYFSLCDWVERDLMLLDRIDTKINMSDHFTKNLSKALFHRHVDFILGHIPPSYSPVQTYIIGTYSDHDIAIDKYVPTSFTTPLTAAAARVFAPLPDDFRGNPWTTVLWHGFQSTIDIMDCGGVLS